MIIPNPAAWYFETFGPDIANDEGVKYAASQKNLANEIVQFFFGAIQNHFTDVNAARFGESCDDNAGESTFGTLQLRLESVPLYELRLRNGNQLIRLFALAYVDGAFRYVLAPRVPDHFPFVGRKAATEATGVTSPALSDKSTKTLGVGGNVRPPESFEGFSQNIRKWPVASVSRVPSGCMRSLARTARFHD